MRGVCRVMVVFRISHVEDAIVVTLHSIWSSYVINESRNSCIGLEGVVVIS